MLCRPRVESRFRLGLACLFALCGLWLWFSATLPGKMELSITCITYGIQKPSFRTPEVKRTAHIKFKWLLLLLLLCGDVRPNPGPTSDIVVPTSTLTMPSSSVSIPVSCVTRPVLASANICGLRGKALHIEAEYIVPYSLCAFALQETKLPSRCNDPVLQIPDYTLFRKDHSGSGGGVAIYVQNSLNPRRLRSQLPASFELVAVQAFFGLRRLILASVYLPPRPRAQMEEQISDLSDWIASLGSSARDLILLGDLNLCPLDNRQPWQGEALSQLCRNFGLSQVVQEATHGDRLIDHCLLGDPNVLCQYGLAATMECKKRGQADGHASLWLQLQRLRCPRPPPVVIDQWKWDEFDSDRATFELLYKQNGDDRNLVAEMWNCDSVDMAAQFVTDELLRVLQLTCPHRVLRFKRFIPWMNRGLLRLTQRKQSAWRAYKRDRDNGQKHARWRHLCCRVCTEVRLAKEKWVKTLFDNVTTICSFWKAVRKVTSSNNSDIPSLHLSDGSYATTDEEKAFALASSLSANYNTSTVHPLPVFPRVMDVDAEFLCDADFVRFHLKQLRPDSATRLDQIPARFLKLLADPLGPIIAALVNRCVLEGQFPRVWKRARIVPIPKAPGTNDINEFRPISILSVLSKVAEQWILHLLGDYLSTHDHHFGFKAHSGTEDAIGFAQVSLEQAMSACRGAKKAAVISLDVAKAFDQCPFGQLISKLHDRGVPDAVLRVLSSYFEDRVQRVKCGRVLSSETSVPSGIGQGSLLGPFLFNVLIDGVFSLELESAGVRMGYADDLLLIAHVDSNASCLALQRDLDKIASFYCDLGLTLNPSKSKVLLCSVSPQTEFAGVHFILNGQPLLIVSDLKYLGVLFSQNISFDTNTDAVCTKAKKMIGALFSACLGLSKNYMRHLYLTKVQPILLYALPVTCPSTKRSWLSLERVNRYACRLLLKDFTSPYTALLQSLSMQSLQNICVQRQLKLCYKYVYKFRHFPIDFPVRQQSRYTLRDHFHPRQLPLPATARLSSLPIFIVFRIWNTLDSIAVSLDLPNFSFYVKNNSRLYSRIYSKLLSNGIEKYLYSIEQL